MTDLLFKIALSNVCLSLALAIVAMVIQVTAKRPHLARLLWLLVLVKLVTPPVVTIPVVTIPGQPDSAVVAIFDIDGQQDEAAAQINGSAKDAYLSAETWSVVLDHGKKGLSLIWFMGSAFVFAWSLTRVYRFNRLLGMESQVAPHELQAAAAKIGSRLGLSAIPTIYTTSAHLSPMVWWIGGKVRIVIPAALLDQMDTRQVQWILAHELAHVRRRDFLVRWIEWLASVCFWWNPVAWWARHNLRANEELCCDALVVSSLKPKPHTYANSLLTAAECLACPALRPPAMASEINSGGFLERRFAVIVSENPNRPNPRWLQACVLLCAVALLPLGVALATAEEDRAAIAARMDTDGDGRISAEERQAYAEAERAATVLEKYDTDGDGVISVEERIAAEEAERAACLERQAAAEAERAAILKRIDTDGDGEISEEERRAFAEAERARERAEIGAYFEGMWARLQAAVEAGELTEEEASARMDELRRRMGERARAREQVDIRAYFEGMRARLQAAIEAGELTEEEASARMDELRRRMGERARAGGRGRDAEADFRGFQRRMIAAVEAGEMTREEASEAIEGYRRRMAAAEAERAAILERLDTDGDGEISEEERRAAAEEERAAIIERLDTDGDGEISAEERAAAGRR